MSKRIRILRCSCCGVSDSRGHPFSLRQQHARSTLEAMHLRSFLLGLIVAGCSESPSSIFPDAASEAASDTRAAECTLIGCGDGIHATFDVARKPLALVGAEFRACFDAKCGTGVATYESLKYGQGPVALDGGPCKVNVYDFGPNGNAVVGFECPLPQSECVDGKTASLSIRQLSDGGTDADADAGLDISYETAVKFHDVYPNGVSCGPHCRTFSGPW